MIYILLVSLFQQSDWALMPGYWSIPVIVDPSFCPIRATCISASFEVQHNVESCIRYIDASITKDGKVIKTKVEQSGVPGKVGWRWSIQTNEIVTGNLEFHVTTIDVCPKLGVIS